MEVHGKFLTRKQVHERYGFSLGYIDKHLPRVKVGRKVVIPVAALDRLLSGGPTDAS